jgi:hypothetical protein
MNQRERTMLIVLGVVAVLAGGFFLLSGGEETPPPPGPTIGPIGQPTVQPTPSGPPKLPPLAIFGGRDPFFPLIREDTTGGLPPTVSPTGSPGPSVSPAPTPTGGGNGVGGHDVRVLDVFVRDGEELVQVEVDGDVFTVGEGDTFAGNFKVVSIDGRCATFLFGDEQFTLCEPGVRPK